MCARAHKKHRSEGVSGRLQPPWRVDRAGISGRRIGHESVAVTLFVFYGAAQESNLPSRGLHDRTGFEDQLGHRAHAAP